MSKSIGNLISIAELIAQRRTAAFRVLVLQSHYRAPLTFIPEGLDSASRGLDRIRVALDDATMAAEPVALEAETIAETTRAFTKAMDDDFDTPKAMAAIFGLVRAINRSSGHKGSESNVASAREKLRKLLDILGIRPEDDIADDNLAAAPFIDLLLNVRESLRATKLWSEADMIRHGLSELGIIIADGPEGAIWRKQT